MGRSSLCDRGKEAMSFRSLSSQASWHTRGALLDLVSLFIQGNTGQVRRIRQKKKKLEIGELVGDTLLRAHQTRPDGDANLAQLFELDGVGWRSGTESRDKERSDAVTCREERRHVTERGHVRMWAGVQVVSLPGTPPHRAAWRAPSVLCPVCGWRACVRAAGPAR